MKQGEKDGNEKQTRYSPIGTVMLLVAAAATGFGMQPEYRWIAAALLLFAVLTLALRKRWWLLSAAPFCAAGAFLLSFKPTGYRYMGLVFLGFAVLFTVLRFGGKRLLRWFLGILAAGLCAFLAFLIPVISDARTDENPEREYLIVLGAAVYGTKPSVSLQNRLIRAEEYLRTYPNARAVLTGGAGIGEDISEAECARVWLTEHGIAGERLLLDEASFSTYENLTNAKALMEAEGGNLNSCAVLSNGYHLCRAKKLANSLGIINPAGVAGVPGEPLYVWGMYIREVIALIRFYIAGY